MTCSQPLLPGWKRGVVPCTTARKSPAVSGESPAAVPRNLTGLRQRFLPNKLHDDVAAAYSLVIESVSGIQKDLVRPGRAIRRADGVANQSIECAEVGISSDPIGRDHHEIMRLLRVRIRHQHQVPLPKGATHRWRATSRAAACRMAFSSAISSGISSILSGFFGRDAGFRVACRRGVGLERARTVMRSEAANVSSGSKGVLWRTSKPGSRFTGRCW